MKLVLSLGLLAGTNVILTFLTNWYILITVGAGAYTDALYAGMAIPQFILAVIGGSFATALIPILSGEREDQFSQQAWTFFWLVAGVLTALAVLLSLLAFLWVPLLVAGFSAPTKSLTIELTHLQLIAMVFSALAGVLTAFGNARQRFLWVGMTPVLAACSSFVILFWGLPRYGIVAAVWAALMRAVVNTALMLPILGSPKGFRTNQVILIEAWRRVKPLLYGATYFKSGPLVDRFLSSMLPPGGLSIFYLAQAAYSIANDVIYKALTTPMLALLANHARTSNWRDYQRVYRKRLRWVSFLTLAGYLVVLLAGDSILMLLIGPGDITRDNIRLLWLTLIAMGGFLVGGAIGQISAAAFYATGDTATPTKVGMLGFTLGSGLKVIGLIKFGLVGIAVAASLHQCFNAFALHALFRRRRYQTLAAVMQR
jgi:putative peptidoglycan lipid II flippase